MAIAADRVEPVFGDALAGDGGMTEPAPTGPRSDSSFDVFPDALSALPLPALTFLPQAGGAGWANGVPAGVAAAAPGVVVPAGRATTPSRPAAGRTAGRAAAGTARSGPPTGPAWSGYPPPGQPFAFQPPPVSAAVSSSRPASQPRQTRPATTTSSTGSVLAPGSSRLPLAGVGYTPPVTTASSVNRPPAYLPQNPRLAGLRAAAQQARPGGRAPASPPSAAGPAAAGTRRSNRAASAWALLVFLILFLVASGAGQRIIDAISQLLHHR